MGKNAAGGRPPLPPSRGGGERPVSQLGGGGAKDGGGGLGGYTSDSALGGSWMGGRDEVSVKQKYAHRSLFCVVVVTILVFTTSNSFSFQIVPAYMLRDQGKTASPKSSKHAVAGDDAAQYQTAR
jgi:hypothetical protein